MKSPFVLVAALLPCALGETPGYCANKDDFDAAKVIHVICDGLNSEQCSVQKGYVRRRRYA